MKPTSTPISLLTHDLGVRSSGSSGRQLIERLENYRVNLLGASRPLEFAQLLQDSDPQRRLVLEELLEWTALDDEFLLIALVALSPELEFTASRLCWGRPSDDTVSELLTQATVALRWTHELVEGERVDFVLSHAFTRTRSEQRSMARHNVPTIRISPDYDAAEPEVEPFKIAVVVLLRAVKDGVITADESSLIQRTHGDNSSLQTLANEFGESYAVLRKRRFRAESRLRQHLDAQGVVR
jgi:hypothetical protein